MQYNHTMDHDLVDALVFDLRGSVTIKSPFNVDNSPEICHQMTILVIHHLFEQLPVDLKKLRPYVSSTFYRSMLGRLISFDTRYRYTRGYQSQNPYVLTFVVPGSIVRNCYAQLPQSLHDKTGVFVSNVHGSQQLFTKNFLMVDFVYSLNMSVKCYQENMRNIERLWMEPHFSWESFFGKADCNFRDHGPAFILRGLHSTQ